MSGWEIGGRVVIALCAIIVGASLMDIPGDDGLGSGVIVTVVGGVFWWAAIGWLL